MDMHRIVCAFGSERAAAIAFIAQVWGHSTFSVPTLNPGVGAYAVHTCMILATSLLLFMRVLLPRAGQVTDMLLLSSDCPGMHQLAVVLESGTILFYDLATYCVPGSAWHPSRCKAAMGHIGPVTTSLEVAFRCPPAGLISSTPAAERAGHGARTSPSAQQQQHQQYQQQYQQQLHSPLPVAGARHPPCDQGSRVAAGGGGVPLLLTGGADGSLRAWDLRAAHLGQAWMAAHPHSGDTTLPGEQKSAVCKSAGHMPNIRACTTCSFIVRCRCMHGCAGVWNGIACAAHNMRWWVHWSSGCPGTRIACPVVNPRLHC